MCKDTYSLSIQNYLKLLLNSSVQTPPNEFSGITVSRGGFRGGGGVGGGGGGGRISLALRDSTPCRPKGSPFDTISEIHFWPTDPKIFLKAPKNGVFDLFFQKISCGAEHLAKTGSFYCFGGRAREINLINLKKKVVKIRP